MQGKHSHAEHEMFRKIQLYYVAWPVDINIFRRRNILRDPNSHFQWKEFNIDVGEDNNNNNKKKVMKKKRRESVVSKHSLLGLDE
jgi:hypothetical protein